MATAKKTSKKASKRSSSKTKATAKPATFTADQVQQISQEAFRRGVRQARSDSDQFLLTLNDAPAFTVLERLRAEWTRVDLAALDDAMRPLQFETYQDKSKEYRWRALAGNGEIIADSGEGYTTATDANRARDQLVALIKAL